jgi:hypothetical protein
MSCYSGETCKQHLVEVTFGCHQILHHPRIDHGGLPIVVEWGNFSKVLDYKMKYSLIMDNQILLHQGGPNMKR